MTMVPSADHHHHQSSLSSSSRQLQRQLLYGGYAGGGCGADYYNYINTAAPDDQLLLMSQVEEGGYDQYYSYCNNNTSITDQSNYLLAAASISSSDLVLVNGSTMATEEDESRTNSLNVNGEPEPEGGETGSSSKPAAHHHHHRRRHHHHHPHVDYQDQTDDDDDNRWLQLSIGGHTRTATGAHVQQAPPQERRRRSELLRGSSSAAAASGLIELDLLPSPPSSSSSRQFHLQRHQASRSPMFHHVPDRDHQISAPNFGTNLYFQNPGIGMGMSNYLPSGFPQQHQEVNWGFRPLIPPPPPPPHHHHHHHHHNHNHIGNSASTSTCSSSPSFMQLGPSSSYFARPFQFLHHGGIGGAPPPGPSLDFRVVDPPRRPHSGIWFMLQASLNQEKEPSLPQIPKSYLRIKDGRMTVRLIKKYLVNKLRLDSESEVEITCRGQQLLPFLTLQHVRDNIWSPRDAASADASLALLQLPDLSVDDHVMVLHYARTSSSTSTTA